MNGDESAMNPAPKTLPHRERRVVDEAATLERGGHQARAAKPGVGGPKCPPIHCQFIAVRYPTVDRNGVAVVAPRKRDISTVRVELSSMVDHRDVLLQGVETWNKWRDQNPDIREPDLVAANLGRTYLYGANLSGADLRRANLQEANLYDANLSGADLRGANLSGAELWRANFFKANLSESNLRQAGLRGAGLQRADFRLAGLRGADLRGANLSEADLSGADLRYCNLAETNLQGSALTNCTIYGVSVWDVILSEETQQSDLIINPGEADHCITVDNLEVAQFVYLLLNNEKIRDVIDTIGEKGVLILGRFTEERKPVLDGIRDKLRELGFVPMMFDFARPTQQDFDETIKTLAGLSRFIIADITNPRSSPLELQATMPDYMVPFVPIMHENEEPFAMFQGLQHKYGEWVLDVLKYDTAANLVKLLEKAVVRPALDKSNQLILKKAEAIRTRHIRDYQ
jgi:uncharacterized protein YjbI with pentapeptide repeats